MWFFIFATLFLFVLGTIIGSFLSVVILRSIIGENWVYGRSRCDNCRKPIAWYDSVPLLSYLLLRGKCRQCKAPILPLHPMVELLTATLLVWWYWGGFIFFQLTQTPLSILQPLFWLTIGLLLIYLFIIDYTYFILPNKAVLALFFLVIAYRSTLVLFGVMQPIDLYYGFVAAVGASLFFLLLWLVTRGNGIGFGDVKFIVPLSLILGPTKTLVGLFLAFVLGSIVGIFLLATGKGKMKTAVPFGPFLIVATALALIWGESIFSWYWSLLI